MVDVSARTWKAMASQTTQDQFVTLYEILIWDGSKYQCLALCNEVRDFISEVSGESVTYIGWGKAVGVSFPSYDFGITAPGQLSVIRLNEELTEIIRTAKRPLRFNITLVNYAEPDIIVVRFEQLFWRKLVYDMNQISGQISAEDFSREPYPGHSWNVATAPGIFQ